MSIVSTELKTAVQAQIAALSVNSTPAELLDAATQQKGLQLDITNLVIQLTAVIAAKSATANSSELIALNAARAIVESTYEGLQIGDYIETEATALPDGRALLPLDERLIDNSYPILQAIFPVKRKLSFVWGIENTITRAIAIKADGTQIFWGQYNSHALYYNGVGVQADPRNVNYYIASDTIHTLGMCCSEDGQKIYAVQGNVSNGDIYVVRSLDGGATTDYKLISDSYYTDVTNVTTSVNAPLAKISCSADGTKIKLILAAYTAPNKVYILDSINSGQDWSETSALTVLSAPSSYVNDVDISRDLSTIFIGRSHITSAPRDRFLSVDGGATFTDVSTSTPFEWYQTSSYAGSTKVSHDGSKVVSWYSSDSDSANLKDIYVSSDNMNTWEAIKLDPKLGSDVGLVYGSWHVFHPNNPNVLFVFFGISGSKTQTLIEVDLVSKTQRVMRVTVNSSINAFSHKTRFTVDAKFSNGRIVIAFADFAIADAIGVIWLDEGKYLVNEQQNNLLKIVADKS